MFSRLAHPSWTSFELLTERNEHEHEGVTYSTYVMAVEDLAALVRLACLSFYKVAHLVPDYFWIDKSPLEAWADTAPSHWFSEAN